MSTVTNRIRFLLIALLVLFAVASVDVLRQEPQVRVGLACPDTNLPCAGAALFGMGYVGNVIHSAYAYEAALLDYSPPVNDIDYMTCSRCQWKVHLPGFTTDRYTHLRPFNVGGSGWVSRWIAPNGGHFALLHLKVLYTGTSHAIRITNPPLPPPALGKILSGDERTVYAILHAGGLNGPPAIGTGYSRGGTTVGLSGWPSSGQYSNYFCYSDDSCAVYDPHLCLLLDARALQWFNNILTGKHRPPKPHPFPLKFWNGYTLEHHKHPVPAYHKHKLTRIAKKWWKHYKKYRGAVSKRYYGVTRTRKEAFYAWRFRCSKAWVWRKSIKFKMTKCLK